MDDHHFGYITKLTQKKRPLVGSQSAYILNFSLSRPGTYLRTIHIRIFVHTYTEFKIRIYYIRSWKPTGRVQVGTTTECRRASTTDEGKKVRSMNREEKKKSGEFGVSVNDPTDQEFMCEVGSHDLWI
jgi:hypothetical protein